MEIMLIRHSMTAGNLQRRYVGRTDEGLCPEGIELAEQKAKRRLRVAAYCRVSTDDEEQLTRLGRFLGRLPNIKALDVLPYHVMGVSKYKELGIPYPLEGVEAATKTQAEKAREVIMAAVREIRTKK